jgi:bacteriocin-like protein
MKTLSEFEMKTINGGNVPTAYYMDNDVINANENIIIPWLQIVGRTIIGLGKEILKSACL